MQERNTFLAFSRCARRTVEHHIETQGARQYIVRAYLRRVVELQESVALSLTIKRYATAWALLRTLQESALNGMYMAELASDTTVAFVLARMVLTEPITLPMKPKAIARELSKKVNNLHGLGNITSKWWKILRDNTHGNPSALPLSLIDSSVPLDPELKRMIIVHAVGPTMSFLAIAEDHKVFDKKTEDHARTVFFGKELFKEL